MLIWHKPDGRGYEVNRSGERGQVLHADPMNISYWGGCRNLWSLIGPNLSPAATHLFHVSASSVHCKAASTFLMAHHHARQAGHNRRGCGNQQENGDDTGKAAHRHLQYSVSIPSHAQGLKGEPRTHLNLSSWRGHFGY
jgi:hypothetical protein